jgi:hypothetical protein
MSRTPLVWPLFSVLLLSCADGGGSVTVDARWNLTCPSGGQVGCGAPAPETCLNDGTGVNERAIVGEHGQMTCTGEPIITTCEAIDRSNGTSFRLEANVGDEFAFELGAVIGTDDGSVVQSTCNVKIIEDQLPYDIGPCGTEPPSVEQPCQLSNITLDGGDITFDLRCESLLSSTTGLGFDVGATGGGATTIHFANCTVL